MENVSYVMNKPEGEGFIKFDVGQPDVRQLGGKEGGAHCMNGVNQGDVWLPNVFVHLTEGIMTHCFAVRVLDEIVDRQQKH